MFKTADCRHQTQPKRISVTRLTFIKCESAPSTLAMFASLRGVRGLILELIDAAAAWLGEYNAIIKAYPRALLVL